LQRPWTSSTHGTLTGAYGLQDLRVGKRVVADFKAGWELLAEKLSECFGCPPECIPNGAAL